MQNKKQKGRILYVDGQEHWLAKGDQILRSSNGGLTWQFFSRLNKIGIRKIYSRFTLSSRLFRAHIDHLIPFDDCVVVFGFKQLFVLDKAGKIISQQAILGSRPLSVCRHQDILYYGEYRANVERSPIRVFKSEDKGLSWNVAWEFENVRHVHGVFVDPYLENAIWVTTGDNDDESIIWRTNDNFKSIERILEGSQQTRAVHLLFTKEYIYFGSDTPDEQNYIYRVRRDQHETEQLTAVGNSVFYGCKVGEDLFFSTAVEPSDANPSPFSEIWHSSNGKDWHKLDCFKKDKLSMKYFQYGQVFFPAGPGDGNHLWITPMATEHDQQLLKLSPNKEEKLEA